MINNIFEDFAQRYGASINYTQGRGRVDTNCRSIEYYDNSKNTVDITLPMHMVKMNYQAEEDYQKSREEERIRKQYPAVADAYQKYKMLLELCK
jgi:hypothetical protein